MKSKSLFKPKYFFYLFFLTLSSSLYSQTDQEKQQQSSFAKYYDIAVERQESVKLLIETANSFSKMRDALRFLGSANQLNFEEKSKLTKYLGWANKGSKLIDAIRKDAERAFETKDKTFLVKGETVKELTNWIIEKRFKESFPGVSDIAKGIANHDFEGHLTVDVLTNYLDGINKFCWGVVGYRYGAIASKDPKMALRYAKAYSEIAGATAKFFRDETLPAARMIMGADKNEATDKLLEKYYTLQSHRLQNGLSIQPINEAFTGAELNSNGFTRNQIIEINKNVVSANIHLLKSREDFSFDVMKKMANETSNFNYTQKIQTVTSISSYADIKRFDPNTTVYIGPRSELDKLYKYNSDIKRYSFEASGNYATDIPKLEGLGFKTVVYVRKDFQDYPRMQTDSKNNSFTEISTPNASQQFPPSLSSLAQQRIDNYVKSSKPNLNVDIEPPKPPYIRRNDVYPINNYPPPFPGRRDPPPPGGTKLPDDYGKIPFLNNNWYNPPPPPSSSISSSNIGGVMLSNIAAVGNNSSKNSGKGNFSFVFNGNKPILDLDEYKKFCTSLWSVYFDPVCPGISIDPISFDTSVKVQMVRYIGNVINNDLGRSMRVADYTMKKWAVGKEKPDISEFKNVDELMAASKINYFGASRRFWFVPEEMKFTAGNNFFLFTGGRMTLKTEYIFLDNKAEHAEPADTAFAGFFTRNYNEIALKYPIYQELYDYAKHVSLCNFLKQNKIPLLWFLLANKNFVVSENSPGTVEQLTKGSKYFEGTKIVGGVDLKLPKGNYVYDKAAVTAINTAMVSQAKQTNFDLSDDNIEKSNTPLSFEYNNSALTSVSGYSLTTNSDLLGNKYQTDLSLWSGNEPGLEIARIANTNSASFGEFGASWRYLIPYRLEIGEINISGFIHLKYCVIKNQITNQSDILVYNTKKYNYIGYIPIDSANSEFIILTPMTDGSFELSDKLGNVYAFDNSGNLTQMILGNQREQHYIFTIDECDIKKHPDIPMSLSLGNHYVSFGDYRVIDEIKITDHINKSVHSLFIDLSSGTIRYIPKKPESTAYKELQLLTNGKYLLTDKSGGKYYFDPSGCILETFSGHEYKIEYEYFEDAIDRFDDEPFVLKASKQKDTSNNLIHPRNLTFINKSRRDSIIFTYSDTSKLIRYYAGDTTKGFRYISVMTNGYFKVFDLAGNMYLFDGGGNLNQFIPANRNSHLLKSVKQGDYKAEFAYTMLPDNSSVVSKINVYKPLDRKLLHTLKYSYDEFGDLLESNLIANK